MIDRKESKERANHCVPRTTQSFTEKREAAERQFIVSIVFETLGRELGNFYINDRVELKAAQRTRLDREEDQERKIGVEQGWRHARRIDPYGIRTEGRMDESSRSGKRKVVSVVEYS